MKHRKFSQYQTGYILGIPAISNSYTEFLKLFSFLSFIKATIHFVLVIIVNKLVFKRRKKIFFFFGSALGSKASIRKVNDWRRTITTKRVHTQIVIVLSLVTATDYPDDRSSCQTGADHVCHHVLIVCRVGDVSTEMGWWRPHFWFFFFTTSKQWLINKFCFPVSLLSTQFLFTSWL